MDQPNLKEIPFSPSRPNDRANILDAMSESERLRLALAEAIQREDYEEVARLKRELEALEEE